MNSKQYSTPKKIIARLKELIATPSISSLDPSWDEGNRDVIDALATWAEDIGFECEIMKISPSGHKANLIATRGSGSGGLVLSGHADTVPFDEEAWKSNPFELSEREGRLYGLGSADMKGFFPLALAAASQFSKQEFRQPLILLATADEESSMKGARSLLSAGRPKARAAIIGEPTSLVPIRMHKGISMCSIKVTGSTGHSSNPALGNNALEGMHQVIAQTLKLRDKLKTDYSNSNFAIPNPTLNLGSIHGGDNPNRICGDVEMLFDLRVTPDCDFTRIKTELEDSLQLLADQLSLTIDLRELMPPVPPFEQSRQSKLVNLAEKLTGHKATSVNFATEAPFIQSLGMDAVIVGPGSIERAHQPNEYLEMRQIKPYLDILQAFIITYCLEV